MKVLGKNVKKLIISFLLFHHFPHRNWKNSMFISLNYLKFQKDILSLKK